MLQRFSFRMQSLQSSPAFLFSIDEHDPVEEPAGVSAAARVVVPDLEVDRRAEMLRTAQQKRTHAASLEVLQAMQVNVTHGPRV